MQIWSVREPPWQAGRACRDRDPIMTISWISQPASDLLQWQGPLYEDGCATTPPNSSHTQWAIIYMLYNIETVFCYMKFDTICHISAFCPSKPCLFFIAKIWLGFLLFLIFFFHRLGYEGMKEGVFSYFWLAQWRHRTLREKFSFHHIIGT